MVDPGLVLALAGFFEVRLVLFCLDLEGDGEAGKAADLASKAQLDNWFVQGYGKEEMAAMLRWHREETGGSVMVVCEFQKLPGGLQRSDFASSTYWLLPEKAVREDLYSILSLASNVMSYKSIEFSNGTSQVLISEHYAIKSTLSKSNQFGKWGKSTGLFVTESSRWERRSDLMGVTLVNTALPWADLVKMNSSNNTLAGFFPDVVTILGKVLNFKTKTIQPPDGKWATREPLENGTLAWTGMVHQLIDGEADFSMVMTITADRSKAVDFSVAILEQGLSLFLLNPDILKNGQGEVHLFVFLSVFTVKAWLAIAGAALAFSLVYTFLSMQHERDKVRILQYWQEFAEGVQYFYLALLQRNNSTGEELVFVSSKIMFLTCSGLCFFLFCYYGGDLTATMTAGAPPPSLKSFEDVLKSDYSFHTNPGTVMYDILQLANPGSTKRKLFDKKLEPMLEPEFKEWQLREPTKAVYFGSQFDVGNNNQFIFLHNFEDYMSTALAMILPKGSEFKSIFDYHIRKLDQAGVLQKLSNKWLDGSRPDDSSHRIFQKEAQPLGYENLSFPALIMTCGVIIGSLLLALENMSIRIGSARASYVT